MGPFIKHDTDTDTDSRQLCDLFKWLPVMDYGSLNVGIHISAIILVLVLFQLILWKLYHDLCAHT